MAVYSKHKLDTKKKYHTQNLRHFFKSGITGFAPFLCAHTTLVRHERQDGRARILLTNLRRRSQLPHHDDFDSNL